MKAKLQNTTQGFKPVEIALTFETQEELETFYKLMVCDGSVHEIAARYIRNFNKKLCAEMMNKVYGLLNDVVAKDKNID